MKFNASKSEDRGIALLGDKNKMIYSIGVSTGGVAEIRMAQLNPSRNIIATTIDEQGVKDSKEYIKKLGFEKQIEVKIEDITTKLPYKNDTFDFIYARLVLHYLTKQQLQKALSEIYRVLKPGGKLFVVVRSDKCPDAHRKGYSYDDTTGITTYPDVMFNKLNKRYFHSEESIKEFIVQAGFEVKHAISYDERLYGDFMRTKPAPHLDNVIEVLSIKRADK